MNARPTPDGESPSTPSLFLPQLRRSRRGSVASLDSTSQLGKETLAEALDHIHITASQSEALTTFNEYTSPPSSSSGPEGKSISSDLQGGLSGLYNRFKASVGNVKDIVTLSGEDAIADDAAIQSPRLALPAPASARSFHDPIKSPNPSIHALGESKSINSSRNSSHGAATAEAPMQNDSRSPRSQNSVSGGSFSGSRIASTPNVSLKSTMNMAASALSVATPAVAEVNVNAVKELPVKDENGNATTVMSAAELANPSLGPFTEVSLSFTAGQRKALSLQSRASDRPDTNEHRLDSPSIVVSKSSMDALEEPATRERNEVVSPKPAHSSKSSVNDDNAPQRRYAAPSGTYEHGKAISTVTRPSNDKTSAATKANPTTTSQNSSTGVPRLVDAEKNIPNTTKEIPQYQHVEISMPKSIQSQTSSRSRTPDVSLTRGSSEVTSASLIHTSGHKVPFSKGTHQDLRSSSTVLSQARSKILNKEYWMRDENARDCFNCGDPFSTFRRKHHCSEYCLAPTLQALSY